jgi:ribose 5-phosphate isomerase B
VKIAFGCDHAAFEIKARVIEALKKQGHSVQDFGCDTGDSCDYPDFAVSVSESVARGKNDRGVLICGTGIGMSIAANKVPGIRAALVWREEAAVLASQHNNANVLCLSARFLPIEEINKCIRAWLATPFSSEPRHQKRVDKMMALDKKGR